MVNNLEKYTKDEFVKGKTHITANDLNKIGSQLETLTEKSNELINLINTLNKEINLIGDDGLKYKICIEGGQLMFYKI